MRDAPYHATLFDIPESERIDHWFYATTNSIDVKPGWSKDVERRMKRDRQFRGYLLIWKRPCNCELPLIGDKRKCELEIAWEHAHAKDRLPNGEHYRPSKDIKTALYFRARSSKSSMAVMAWLEEHATGRTA
jgi:hypothetical protein